MDNKAAPREPADRDDCESDHQNTHCEIAVVGAGPAGLAAALLCAQRGFDVVLIGPPPPQDFRTSALMTGSVDILAEAGIWSKCEGAAAPLEHLRIVDDTGRLLRAPEVLFHAREIGEFAFAWNIANSHLVDALNAAVAACPNLVRVETPVADAQIAPDQVTLVLENGGTIAAPLVLASDGRRSRLREAAAINVRRWQYPQTAVVVNIRHSHDHANTSTEFHRRTGPFTLVPLPNQQSAIVAVEDANGADWLMSLGDDALAAEIEQRSHRILGNVTPLPGRASFPLGGLVPAQFGRDRIMLVGEAAHVVPPIGAQGLNLGLRDAANAARVAAAHRHDPGNDQAMAAFNQARSGDIRSRSLMIDLLNRSLLSPMLPAQMARSLGMAALRDIGPLRRLFMREGMEHRGFWRGQVSNRSTI